MQIRQLRKDEPLPIDLLLLADPSLAMIETYIKQGQCFIGEINDQIVGTYVLLATKPNTVEIMNIAVDEGWQGKGLGKKLILHAINYSKENGQQTIQIGTGNSSISQLALYQKCGFRITKVEKDFFTKHYVDEIYENGIQCRDRIRLSMNI